MSSPEFADNLDRPEFELWSQTIPTTLALSGNVVAGFKRGSKQLGVPTANIEMTEENIAKTANAVPGVYMGFCTLHNKTYRAAVSIGWNPVFDNAQKTVEAYLLPEVFAEPEVIPDFYGEFVSLELKQYLRAEALFPDFDALLIAISCDIQVTKDFNL